MKNRNTNHIPLNQPASLYDDGNIPPVDLPRDAFPEEMPADVIPDEIPRKDGPGGESGK